MVPFYTKYERADLYLGILIEGYIQSMQRPATSFKNHHVALVFFELLGSESMNYTVS